MIKYRIKVLLDYIIFNKKILVKMLIALKLFFLLSHCKEKYQSNHSKEENWAKCFDSFVCLYFLDGFIPKTTLPSVYPRKKNPQTTSPLVYQNKTKNKRDVIVQLELGFFFYS